MDDKKPSVHGPPVGIQEIIERFEDAWTKGPRPRLADFLLPHAQPHRHALVIELVHVELELRLKAGDKPPLAEAYLRLYEDEFSDPTEAVALIAAEYQWRWCSGSGVAMAEYLERLPQYDAELRERLKPKWTCPNCRETTVVADEVLELVSCPTCGETSPAHPIPVDPKRFSGGAPRSVERLVARPDQPQDPWPTNPAGGSSMEYPKIPGYEILDQIGKGGMGVVYKARDVNLDRLVAIKMILADSPGSPEDRARFKARFRREAEAVARFQHPHIVQIFRADESKGEPYIVMEFVEGGSLAKRIKGQGQQPFGHAARLIEFLARAVHEAHNKNIVHRDLKPANILLAPTSGGGPWTTPYGLPKVADFGLAKLRDAGGFQTTSGVPIGTPCYMAPEQAEGRTHDIGPRTDVYALGAILFELLTGRPPFVGMNVLEVLRKIVDERLEPPRKLRPECPVELEHICVRCLAKAASDRYASALELAEDLARWAVVPASLAPEKYEYYRLVVKRRGCYEGIDRLGEEDVRHRWATYKLTIRAGYVKMLEVVNGHGVLVKHNAITSYLDGLTGAEQLTGGTSQVKINYDEEGHVIQETALDRAGATIYVFHYTANRELAHYTDQFGLPCPRAPSGAAYVKFIRRSDGLDEEVHFVHKNGKDPQPNRDGIFRQRLKYDESGRVREVTFLDAESKPTHSNLGFATMRHVYDLAGKAIESHVFAPDGEPAYHRHGYAVVKAEYDKYGNAIELAFFGSNGRPTINKKLGCARITTAYDEHGDVVETKYYGLDDHLTLSVHGVAQIRSRCDGEGNLVEAMYFDAKGDPCPNNQGFAKVTRKYDGHGNMVEETCFDAEGRRTLNNAGYSRARQAYDHAWPIESKYFDADDGPTLHKDGNASITIRRDKRGNVTEQIYYGLDGQQTRLKDGYSQTKAVYNEAGNQEEVAYFGPGEQATLHKLGFAKIRFKHDARGNVIETTYLGLDGQFTRHKDWYAHIVKTHDHRGNVLSEAYFGPDGKTRTLIRSGFASARMTYDERNQLIRMEFFDVDGNPTRKSDGIASFKATYDERGNRTSESYFGPDGTRTFSNQGFAVATMGYDAHDRRTGEACFGLQEERAIHRDGYWRLRLVYDHRGYLAEKHYFGIDGAPVAVSGVAKIAMKYDDRGNVLEERYFAPNRNPTRGPHGAARIAWRYDARDNKIEETYFDDEDQRTVTNGVAKVLWKYDDRGNRTEQAYFDLKNQPSRNWDGNAKITWEYDDRGNPIKLSHWDETDQLVPVDGRCTLTMRYDELGNQIEFANFDSEGVACPNVEGFAKCCMEYDDRGHMIEFAFFDQHGQRTLSQHQGREMFHKTKLKYDERGNQEEQVWYGLDGGLTLLGDAAMLRSKHDARGNRIQREWFGTDGRPTNNAYGFTKVVATYDDLRGHQTEESYYGPKGEPVARQQGYGKVRWWYDELNRRKDAAYFDIEDRVVRVVAVVSAIKAGSGAERVGLKVEDVLLSYDGRPVINSIRFSLQREIEQARKEATQLVVRRHGEVLSFFVTPEKLAGADFEDRVVP
jgi:eukaryotic-like serine/threonine-protein kinase